MHPQARDVYDVLWNAPALPAEMSPRLSREDVKAMARLEQTVHPAATSGDHALATSNTTAQTPAGWVFAEMMDLPANRTVLATAKPDVFWRHCLEIEWNWWRGLCRGGTALEPGSQQEIEIGAAVHVAAVTAFRYPDALQVGVGHSDGRRRMHVANPDVVQDSRLVLATAEGETLGSVEGVGAFFPVSEGQERFRLTHERRLYPGQFHAATESRTVWDFRAVQGQRPVLLDAEYGPEVDVDGVATPLRPLPLQLSFEPGDISAEVSPERITRAQAWWSTDDGNTWHRLRVRRRSDISFSATVPAPALTPGADLSLRVAAADDSGNSVDQSSIRLVPVRKG